MKTPQQLLQQTLEVGACLLPDAASGGRTGICLQFYCKCGAFTVNQRVYPITRNTFHFPRR